MHSAGSWAGRPTPDERTMLLELLEAQTRRIAEGRVGPVGAGHRRTRTAPALPAGVSPAQLAAYTVVSRVLLNLDETITKE